MQYYNQTDKKEVEAMRQGLIESGFDVSVSQAECSVIRETSKYNKYMKWHAVTRYENGGLCSDYFKSKPEAIKYLTKPRRPLPAGNRMLISYVKLTE